MQILHDANDLSDDFLATCVDEYIRRVVATVRENPEFNKDTVHVTVDASQSYYDGEFTVKHKVQVGDSYDSNGYARAETDNAITGARSCINRLFVDRAHPPRKYSALLPAPEAQLTSVASDPLSHIGQEEVDADAAEFTPIPDQGEEQIHSDEESGASDLAGDEADDQAPR